MSTETDNPDNLNPFLVDLDQTPLSSPINVNKEVPPPPPSDTDEDDEDETPDLYLPGLILPTMFLPIPNTDPLTTLLTKHVPPELRPTRDLTGSWQHAEFDSLVASNSWRALATFARDKITSIPTPSTPHLSAILSLWSLRLSSLARLRLFNQCSAECTNLFSVLNSIEPAEHRRWIFETVLPWEVEVMRARVVYWKGDHMGYLDELYELLRRCKKQLKTSDTESKAMWKERGARMGLIIASQLIEMKDFTAAISILNPIVKSSPSQRLHSAIARIHLQSGNLNGARHHFALSASSLTPSDASMLAAAEGDWAKAEELLKAQLKDDEEDWTSTNNLAVALLSQGKLKEGINVLENALKVAPGRVVTAEPFLFNLSTLYELRASSKKRDLLIEVAKWSGDGLRTACLKMPTT